MSEPTGQALICRVHAVQAVLESTCRHCVAGVQAVKAVSEPTCRELCCRAAGCFSRVGTYLPGTVLQGCRLFKWCWNLHAGHSVALMQAAEAMSEPTCQALCCRFPGCWRGVGTYLSGTVLQRCRLVRRCGNLPARHCVSGCRLFKWYLNLPARQCRLLKQC